MLQRTPTPDPELPLLHELAAELNRLLDQAGLTGIRASVADGSEEQDFAGPYVTLFGSCPYQEEPAFRKVEEVFRPKAPAAHLSYCCGPAGVGAERKLLVLGPNGLSPFFEFDRPS